MTKPFPESFLRTLSEVPVTVNGSVYLVSTRAPRGRLEAERAWAEYQIQKRYRELLEKITSGNAADVLSYRQ